MYLPASADDKAAEEVLSQDALGSHPMEAKWGPSFDFK